MDYNTNINQIVNEIFFALDKDKSKSDISLMEGTPGVILFLYFYSIAYNDNHAKNQYEKKLNKLLKDFNDDSGELKYTYCDGLIGFLTFLNFIGAKNNEYSGLIDESFEDSIYEIMMSDLKKKEYDFLHGALGAFNYYLIKFKYCENDNERAKIKGILGEGLKILDEISYNSAGDFGWNYPIYDDPRFKDKICINMGLAHGTPGVLAILCDLHRIKIDTVLTEKLIYKICSFLISKRSTDLSSYSQFPFYYSPALSLPYDSPLAWCYGDLSVATALFKAGHILNDESIKDNAISIAQTTTHRKSVKQTSIFDSSFCHGTSGIAFLYQVFYKHTNKQEFKVAKDYWIEKTIEYSSFKSEGIAGFRTYAGEDHWGRSIGLLKGVSGIGLVLLGLLFEETEWSGFLLLDNV